jgi:hypothetical protein
LGLLEFIHTSSRLLRLIYMAEVFGIIAAVGEWAPYHSLVTGEPIRPEADSVVP